MKLISYRFRSIGRFDVEEDIINFLIGKVSAKNIHFGRAGVVHVDTVFVAGVNYIAPVSYPGMHPLFAGFALITAGCAPTGSYTNQSGSCAIRFRVMARGAIAWAVSLFDLDT